MVPVDLPHAARLERALQVAADLAGLYQAEVCYVAVTASTPGPKGRNPEEFAKSLESFASSQGATHGHRSSSRAMVSTDPSIDMDDTLLKACKETGADLVVMASHVPNVADTLFPSHGGKIARKAGVSVMVVREG
nr:universal stress protein [Pontibaca salina]